MARLNSRWVLAIRSKVRAMRDRIANSEPSSNQFISRLTFSKFIFATRQLGRSGPSLSRLERTRRDYEAIKLRWILIKCPSICRPSQRQQNVLRVDLVLLAKCSASSDASGAGGAAGEDEASFRSSEPTNQVACAGLGRWPRHHAGKRDRGQVRLQSRLPVNRLSTPAPSTAITAPIVNS